MSWLVSIKDSSTVGQRSMLHETNCGLVGIVNHRGKMKLRIET